MSKGFYRQLAKTNMKKNGKIYTPYILSVIAAVAMFYIIQSLALNPGFENMLGFDTMNSILIFACWVVRIFLVIFMLYTNSFLIKQRRKEFGVYHMLGLEKKHLAITLFWESLSVLVIGLFAGILFGMLLDKLLYAVLIRMLGFSVPLGFFVSPLAIGRTVALFVVIMALNYFYDIAQIHATSPIELLHGTDMGERNHVQRLLAILGFILLAIRLYYFAENRRSGVCACYVFCSRSLRHFWHISAVYSGKYCVTKIAEKEEKFLL